MPTRYLFEQVVTIFESNKCVLLDTTYTNQLQKLNYIATCGHTNSVSLKMFLRGNGIKCKPCALNLLTFQTIIKCLSEKGCNLAMTEEEFNAIYDEKNKVNVEMLRIRSVTIPLSPTLFCLSLIVKYLNI